jgi:hypothetical protein
MNLINIKQKLCAPFISDFSLFSWAFRMTFWTKVTTFEVFATMNIQVLVFCVVTPCSDVVGYQRSEDIAASILTSARRCRSSETLVSYITTRCHDPKDPNLKHNWKAIEIKHLPVSVNSEQEMRRSNICSYCVLHLYLVIFQLDGTVSRYSDDTLHP